MRPPGVVPPPPRRHPGVGAGGPARRGDAPRPAGPASILGGPQRGGQGVGGSWAPRRRQHCQANALAAAEADPRSTLHCCHRPHSNECTASHLNCAVKHWKVWLVLGWGTAWEYLQMLMALLFLGGTQGWRPPGGSATWPRTPSMLCRATAGGARAAQHWGEGGWGAGEPRPPAPPPHAPAHPVPGRGTDATRQTRPQRTRPPNLPGGAAHGGGAACMRTRRRRRWH